MTNVAGRLLVSSSSLADTNFEQAVIFITEHNEKGAVGFVVNKLFSRTLNELEEFKHSRAIRLYDGGPVDREHLFFIHQRPDLIAGGSLIAGTIYLGGDFKQVVHYLNDAILPEDDIKIFIGYCGWDPHQLEEEIEEGSWLVSAANAETILCSLLQ